MGPYPPVYEVGMSLAYTTLIFSLIKVIHAKHLQWYLMRKVPTAWEQSYGAGSLGVVYTINSGYGRILTAAECSTRGTLFVKFVRVSNLGVELIKKQDFGITCKVVEALLERCEE